MNRRDQTALIAGVALGIGAPQPAMRFPELLQRFAAAVMADDRPGLTLLFTQDGIY